MIDRYYKRRQKARTIMKFPLQLPHCDRRIQRYIQYNGPNTHNFNGVCSLQQPGPRHQVVSYMYTQTVPFAISDS